MNKQINNNNDGDDNSNTNANIELKQQPSVFSLFFSYLVGGFDPNPPPLHLHSYLSLSQFLVFIPYPMCLMLVMIFFWGFVFFCKSYLCPTKTKPTIKNPIKSQKQHRQRNTPTTKQSRTNVKQRPKYKKGGPEINRQNVPKNLGVL